MVMTGLPQTAKQKRHYAKWIVLGVIVAVVVTIILNRAWIYDWYRGASYQPTAEMATIREKLELTGKGEFVFGAAQPVLSAAKEFNANCRQDETEIAVLGCYTEGNIYVYNITDTNLDGIRELTTAHELLHAVWARMSDDEKKALVEPLTRTFEANQVLLGAEIESYDIEEKQEELYVRAGTEIRELPAVLEKHYGEIFDERRKVVGYYEQYIGVFREIKSRMEVLEVEMETLSISIGEKTEEYTRLASQLEADIVSFNSCAEVAGCFRSESEFNLRRNELINRQNELEALNEEINQLIDEYNIRVDEYNADVTESRKLQDMINSNSKVEF